MKDDSKNGALLLKNSIRFKLAVVVVTAVLLLGATTLFFNYLNGMKQHDANVSNNFSLIADILKNDITRWLTNRENDIITMAANPLLRQYIDELDAGHPNADHTGEKLERYWMEIKEQYGVYDDIYFVTRAGQILLTTEHGRKGTFRQMDDLLEKPLEIGQLYFMDAYLSYKNEPSIAYSMPITKSGVDTAGNPDYAGVLVYRVDIADVLVPLLEGRISLGETGEIILVNKGRTAITELRKLPGSALNYVLNSEPAYRVVQGEEGISRSISYTDQEVLAVYRYLPNVQWGLIIRQETSEIFGPLRAQVMRSIFTNLILVIVVLGIIYIVLNRFLGPVNDMARVAREISRGDFSRRIDLKTNDELSLLGQSINSMAKNLGQQFKLQQSEQDVLESLVSTIDTGELLGKGLRSVCKSFDFKVGAVFLVDIENGSLVQKALYCPGRQLMDRSGEIKIGEGLEGLAAITGQVHVLKDLPGDTAYTINWLGGSMIPRSIAVVPLVFGSNILGVMSLASLKEISEQEVQTLATIGALTGVAINNTLSYQRTRDLSRSLQEVNEQLAQQNEELNAQSEELTCQTEELQAQSEELRVQSEELQDTTRELRAKNVELEKVGHLRTKLYASLSHELRAPLNAVVGFSDVLLDRVVGEINPQQEKYLQEIHISGQHLLKLINDLLDLSKIEAGGIELNIQEIDPAIPLEEALAMVKADCSSKKLVVKNVVDRHRYLVHADQHRLRQIFLNLLTNAVKFTPEGGWITIGARAENKDLHLWVADNGSGINKEHYKLIFEEFKQVGSNFPGADGGTGLGLPITRKLLALQGGRIYVESEEGKGSVFTFTLPLVDEHHPAQNRLSCDHECPKAAGCELCDCPRSALTYLAKPVNKAYLLNYIDRATCSMLGKPTTILVVDDDPAVRSFISAILEPRGNNLLMAEDGKNGIELALSKKPEIIILDIMMPGVDGFKVIEELSRHNWDKGLCMAILTSKDLALEEKKILERWYEDILTCK